MTWQAMSGRPYGAVLVVADLHGVAAHVEFESKIGAKMMAIFSYYSFKGLIPGTFKLGLIGSSCATLPWCRCRRGT